VGAWLALKRTSNMFGAKSQGINSQKLSVKILKKSIFK